MDNTKHPLLFSVGVNHSSAPLNIREKLSVSNDELPELLSKFKEILSECFIISTCNRTELYGVTENEDVDTNKILEILLDFKSAKGIAEPDDFFNFISCSTANHLFKVATSVDSLVIGDVQILHQVKESYNIAKESGSTGSILNQLCQKALRTGKRVRSETPLFEGAFSVSFAAVELAKKIFGELTDKNILIIGAGETAELTAKNLIKKKVKKIFITNRTKENALLLKEKLSSNFEFETEIIEFENFKEQLEKIDIVISSTGAKNYIIDKKEFQQIFRKRRGSPMLIIDIAIPRDFDPEIDDIENVFLKNMDNLNEIVYSDQERRMSVLPKVKEIIDEELIEFLVWYYSILLTPSIQQLQQNPDNGESFKKIKEMRRILTDEINFMHKKISSIKEDKESIELEHHFNLIETIKKIRHKTLSGN